ncbi:POU domain protein 2-like [Drosophila serrata]|uniref:POU domain protein 2-like n=1 Tax=Drosophila serrata TaxID=7274 RepID=UPI000A1CF9C4|nr:POU domain protein 2-like [Drosophila serrata]
MTSACSRVLPMEDGQQQQQQQQQQQTCLPVSYFGMETLVKPATMGTLINSLPGSLVAGVYPPKTETFKSLTPPKPQQQHQHHHHHHHPNGDHLFVVCDGNGLARKLLPPTTMQPTVLPKEEVLPLPQSSPTPAAPPKDHDIYEQPTPNGRHCRPVNKAYGQLSPARGPNSVKGGRKSNKNALQAVKLRS